jgi:hypothetical protein
MNSFDIDGRIDLSRNISPVVFDSSGTWGAAP